MKEVKVKEDKRERETKEREDADNSRKREKDKERRREKRATSPPADAFEGDLSSVSNSSNGSIPPTADLVIVDDQRGGKIFDLIFFQIFSFFYFLEFSRIFFPVLSKNFSIF